MAVYEPGLAPSDNVSRTSLLVNYAGAALSFALIAGVGVWGYKLIMRDVSGIPVVRAMAGDMRVLPDNPGGSVAAHTGLSVNAVAAVGEAAGPEDTLVLAPQTPGLTAEDLSAQPMAEADEFVPEEDVAVEATPVSATQLDVDDVLALADQIAADVPAVEVASDAIAADVPGVATSLRPLIRPASLQIVEEAAPPAAVTQNVEEVAVTTTEFAAGTTLVQLGAFPSPDSAAGAWTRLNTQFGELLNGKERVIQVATRNGNTFYRLRATGFDEKSDARRFCAALDAEGADCIPVKVN